MDKAGKLSLAGILNQIIVFIIFSMPHVEALWLCKYENWGFNSTGDLIQYLEILSKSFYVNNGFFIEAEKRPL